MFTITGPSNIQLLKFWLFNFPNFHITFFKNFMKRFPGFKIDSESTDKVLPLQQYLFYNLKFLDNETPALWIFFDIFTEERFSSEILSNEGNIKASILLTHLKCIVVGYSNGNKSFTCRLLSNYAPLNMLFRFFNISFIVFFTKLLSKCLWRNHPFSTQLSKIHFKM